MARARRTERQREAQATGRREGQRRLAHGSATTRRLPGIPDELLGAGRRAAARSGSRFFGAFGRACARRDRAAASAGRPPSARGRRLLPRARRRAPSGRWPLSHLPLLIDEADWKQLSAGIAQRAELFELVLRDIYGEGRLVAEGALPAAAIAGSPEYLRPLCGVEPPGGRYPALYAADLGRGPDGRWWVLGDRTQAPSGAGYALENRLVLSRAFSDLYKSMNVQRLAPFFEAFRDGLRATRRPRRAAHRPADARRLQRDLFRARLRWRAISASCWSRATTSPSATAASTSAPSPA